MTLVEIIQIVSGIMLSVGGAGAIIIGVSKFLGNIIANRIVEKERARNADELEKTKAKLIKTVYVHQGQFQTEFNAYKEIWKTLSEVKYAVLQLRPAIDQFDPKETEEQRKINRLTKFTEKYNTYLIAIDQSKPFYHAKVWDSLNEVRQTIHIEAIDYQFLTKSDEDYWKKAIENNEKILSQIDNVCLAIQERINSMSIID